MHSYVVEGKNNKEVINIKGEGNVIKKDLWGLLGSRNVFRDPNHSYLDGRFTLIH